MEQYYITESKKINQSLKNIQAVIIFLTIQFFLVCEVVINSRSSTVRGHVHMHCDVAHNMYQTAAVYQRIFNSFTQILH